MPAKLNNNKTIDKYSLLIKKGLLYRSAAVELVGTLTKVECLMLSQLGVGLYDKGIKRGQT